MSEDSPGYGFPNARHVVTDPANEAVRYCGTCRRDTAQRDMCDCLDAAHYICTVCQSSEIVPEGPLYGLGADEKPK